MNAVLLDEVEDVQMKAHLLFSACPGHTMTLSGDEIGKLANEVCCHHVCPHMARLPAPTHDSA